MNFRDTTQIQSSFKVKMTAVGEIYTLTISGITIKMSGNYRCVATNKHGTAEHAAVITVSDGKEKKPEEKKPEEKKPTEEEVKPEEKKPAEAKPKPEEKKEQPKLKKGQEPPQFVETYSDLVRIILNCRPVETL